MALSVWNLNEKIRLFLKSYDLVGTSLSGPHKGTPGYIEWLRKQGFSPWLKKISELKGVNIPEFGTPEWNSLPEERKDALIQMFQQEQKTTQKEPQGKESAPHAEKEIGTEQQKELAKWIDDSFPEDLEQQNYARALAYSLSEKTKDTDKIKNIIGFFSKPSLKNHTEWTLQKANLMKKEFGGSVSPSSWIIANAAKGKDFAWATNAALDLMSPSIYLTSIRIMARFGITEEKKQEIVAIASAVAVKTLREFPPTSNEINQSDWLPKRMSLAVPKTVQMTLWGSGRAIRLSYSMRRLQSKIKKYTDEAVNEDKEPTNEYLFERVRKDPAYSKWSFEDFKEKIGEIESTQTQELTPPSEDEPQESLIEQMGETDVSIDKSVQALDRIPVNHELIKIIFKDQAKENEKNIKNGDVADLKGRVFKDPRVQEKYEELKIVEQIMIDEWFGDFAREELSPGLGLLFVLMMTPRASSKKEKGLPKYNRAVYRQTRETILDEEAQKGTPKEEAKKIATEAAKKAALKEDVAPLENAYSLDMVVETLLEPSLRPKILAQYEEKNEKRDLVWEFVSSPEKFYKTEVREGEEIKTLSEDFKNKLSLQLGKNVFLKLQNRVQYDQGVANAFKLVSPEGKTPKRYLDEVRDKLGEEIGRVSSEIEKGREREHERSMTALIKKKVKAKLLDLEKEEMLPIYRFIFDSIPGLMRSTY